MNIRVDLDSYIRNGTEIVFRSPVDCSQVTGLIVYYKGEDGNTGSQEFAFADAHGNNVGDIDHLFAENVVVKVILDLVTSMAFVQNADTNAYLENRIDGVDLTLPQELDVNQQSQVWQNIGLIEMFAKVGEAINDIVDRRAVRYDAEQTLTDEQKATARANIGALTEAEMIAYVEESILGGEW